MDTLLNGVNVDDALGDVHVSENEKHVLEFNLISIAVNVELFNTLEGNIFILDKDLDWIVHDVLSHLNDLRTHSSRDQHNLGIDGDKLKDVVDLSEETLSKHLISLIEDEESEVARVKVVLFHHIIDSSWCSDDYMATFSECANVINNVGSTYTEVHLNLEVNSELGDNVLDLDRELSGGCENERLNLLFGRVNKLEHANCEGGSLS